MPLGTGYAATREKTLAEDHTRLSGVAALLMVSKLCQRFPVGR